MCDGKTCRCRSETSAARVYRIERLGVPPPTLLERTVLDLDDAVRALRRRVEERGAGAGLASSIRFDEIGRRLDELAAAVAARHRGTGRPS